jgi:hypothetical protein
MGLELIVAGFVLALFLVSFAIMFLLGYRDAMKYKIEDPTKIDDLLVGEGFDKDVFEALKYIEEQLGRELNDEELRYFLMLVEEGYHGEVLIKKFMEFAARHKDHH